MRRETELIPARRQIDAAEHADAGLLHARFGFGLEIHRHRVIVPAADLALRVEGDVRDLELVVCGRFQVAAAHLHAEQHRRIRRRTLERRGKHVHRQAADRNGAVERLAHLGAGRVRGGLGRRGGGLHLRQRVAAARAHRDARARDAHVDTVKLSGLVAWRIVREHVVRAVVLDDAIERRVELVAVDDGEATGFVGDGAQAVLREPHLVPQRAGPDAQRRVVGERRDGDAFVLEAREPPRIDPVDGDVGLGRRRDQIARLIDDRRGGIVVEHIGDVVVDAFADEEDRLAAAVH